MKNILTALYNLAASVNPHVTALGSAVLAALAAFRWVNDQWAMLIVRLDAMLVSGAGSSLNVAPLGLVDTFVPLHEACTFFTAWCGLLLSCTVLRIGKSFIPTVSS